MFFSANFLISRIARGARFLKVILCSRLCRLIVYSLRGGVCVCERSVEWGAGRGSERSERHRGVLRLSPPHRSANGSRGGSQQRRFRPNPQPSSAARGKLPCSPVIASFPHPTLLLLKQHPCIDSPRHHVGLGRLGALSLGHGCWWGCLCFARGWSIEGKGNA